jgi:putative MATE family efflux protein
VSRKNLHRNIFTLSWPAVVEHLFFTITAFVDMVMVSRLGTDSIAAVGLASTLFFIFISVFGFPLRIAAQALTARFAGEGSPKKIKISGGNVLFVSVIFGITISLFGIFGSNILMRLMGTSETVYNLGSEYLTVVLGCSVFAFVYFSSTGIIRGMGDTRTPMFLMGLGNVFNIVFNYFLIFGIGVFPRLEVLGAAIATGGAYILGGILILLLVHLRKKIPVGIADIRRIDPKAIQNIWKIASPAVLEFGIRRTSLFFFLKMVACLGTAALAAHQLALRIESFSFMIGIGFGIASNTLVGQSLGAKRVDLADESIKKISYYAIAVMSLIAFFFVLKPEIVFSIFKPEFEVKIFAIIAIIIAAFEQIPLAYLIVIAGGLNGAGDTKTPMIISFIGSIPVRLSLAYLFAFKLGYGFAGIWLAAVCDWMVEAILAVIAFYNGKWREIEFK